MASNLNSFNFMLSFLVSISKVTVGSRKISYVIVVNIASSVDFFLFFLKSLDRERGPLRFAARDD